jgi:cytochrome c oxidase subunit 2
MVINFINIKIPNKMIYSDYGLNWSYGFQDPANELMYSLIELHDNIIFYLIIIATVVFWVFISSLTQKDHLKFLQHGDIIELIWTITPALILWAIGIPSLILLYLMDEILDAEITVKITGNQWYWNYEYSDYVDNFNEHINFDSFLINEHDLEIGDLRQLTVDNYLVLPVNTNIRLLVTSNDVLHSFALPSLAIKADAIPGRLNSTGVIFNRPSTFYGQCSELCGGLHGFMPIGVHAVNISNYINFLKANLIQE